MSRTTRYALIAAATLLTVIGLTAVVAVFRGTFGPVEQRLIASASILLGASAVGAVGVHAHLARSAVRLGLVTAGLAALAAVQAIVIVWMPDDSAPVALGKSMAITAVVAAVTGLHSALRTWAHDVRWLVKAIVVVAYLAAADFAAMLILERGGPLQTRFLAAAAILIPLGIVLLPILSRLRSAGHHPPTTHV